ncbi:unnamed protein product, partial [Prorocentrum cordatum]
AAVPGVPRSAAAGARAAGAERAAAARPGEARAMPAARREAAASVPPGKPAAGGPPPEAPADWPPSQWAEREAGLRLLPVADGAGVDEELRRLEAVRRQAERAERLLADAEAQATRPRRIYAKPSASGRRVGLTGRRGAWRPRGLPSAPS